MIGLMANIIVEPSEAWPVVAAGLGSAVIVGWITSRVAKKQRKADSDRFDKQLVHDRDMRAEQLSEASKRLDRQLAHDRKMQEQQMRAASFRLQWQLGEDRQLRREQLAHDREMRDLQHMRETLTPIAARAQDWDAFTTLHQRLKADGVQPIDDETWKSKIVPLASELASVNERLRRDARTLVILAGPTAQVAVHLKEIASEGDAMVHVTRQRVEAGGTTPELQAAVDGIWTKYAYVHARFMEAANEAVRWGEAPGPSEQES